MIEKVYEDRFGTVHYTGLAKDLDIIKSDEKYLSSKANGSKFYNIEDLSNSLIWDNENKQWLNYNARGNNNVYTDNNIYTDEEVNNAIDNILNND